MNSSMKLFSGALFGVVTIALWALLLPLVGRWLPKKDFVAYVGPVEWLHVSRSLAEAPRSLINVNVTLSFMIGFAALIAFLAAALWAVFPSVLAEIHPPVTHPAARSRALGIWLSRGLVLVGWVASIGTIAVASILSLEILAFAGVWSPDKSPECVAVSSALLGGLTALLLLVIGTRQWMAGALAALDVILDVDNYMREHPRESAPRARIAERYVSLLRYLCRWKDRNGRGYDAIIVVAHSQGSVITADLLRFLQIERSQGVATWEQPLAPILDDQAETRIPIDFFTMGSPLRQLYGRAFPHHYAWLDEDLLGVPLAKASPIQAHTAPDPATLGVRHWVNAYRSGDYVGRTIWLSHQHANVWEQAPPVKDDADHRREHCIGRGAHTHYWDETAAGIAADLHGLLGDAARDARRRMPGAGR